MQVFDLLVSPVTKVLRLLLVLLCAAASLANAQTCASPGLDGPATPSGVINSYHGGVGTPSGTSVSVASATGLRTNTRALRAGDLILIMQMQDSATPANAGVYEYAHIASIAGTALTLRSPLVNSYNQTMNTTNVRNFQVVWVPQYSAATVAGTVSADRWTINTGTLVGSGGVVAMDVAGSLALTGTVTAAGSGFRGAMGLQGTNANGFTATVADRVYTPTSAVTVSGGQKGEGSQGTPPVVFAGTLAGVTYTAVLGQGYAGGAGGQAAAGNAGGGANNGLPGDANNFNAGGGGGGNAGAGGQGGNSWNNGNTLTIALNQNTTNDIGNVAGGKGGNAIANSATRLAMGGGGGAGGVNNASANVAPAPWPPTPSFPPGAPVANGASGAITSSGASGGGVVLIRAGSISGGGRVDASGYQAYNKALTGDTDAGGGGGAGGSIFVTAGSGGTALTLSAPGGAGGSTNYFHHGPGGGGGGGYISTNFVPAAANVAGATSGTDACCGATGAALGPVGGNSPGPWNSTAGAIGSASTGGGSAAGVQGGGACLPALTLVKTTLTPLLVVPAQTTAQYVFTITNPASGSGAAYGVAVRDAFPAPFGLAAVTDTASFTVSGIGTQFNGPGASVPNSSGVTPTVQLGTPGSMTNTFTVFPGGSVTLTLLVRLNTTTIGTYQNSGTVTFTDPTRTTGVGATVTGAAANPTVSPGQAYAGGGTAAGSNYASGSSTNEDVRLINGTTTLTVTKTNVVTTLASGQTTSYTVTVANLGGSAAPGTILQDPVATGLACTTVTCSVTGGAAACPAGITIGALQSTGISITPTFPAVSSLTFVVTCNVTATGS